MSRAVGAVVTLLAAALIGFVLVMATRTSVSPVARDAEQVPWDRLYGDDVRDDYWVDRLVIPGSGVVLCIHSGRDMSCVKEPQEGASIP